jgi:biotin operon repressor
MKKSIDFKTENLFLLDKTELRLHLFLEAQEWISEPSAEYIVCNLGMSRAVVFRAIKGLKKKGVWNYE